MDTLSVCIVALFQVMGYSYFIRQPADQCSAAPTLGSWVYLMATLCFLWDLSIYPRRFMHMAWHWQLLIEIVAGTFLAEIAVLIIWCGMERVIYWLTQTLIHAMHWDDCGHELYEYLLHGLTTVAVSGALLWFIVEATDTSYWLTSSLHSLRRNWHQTWHMMKCICRMNSCERRRTLKACRLAMCPTRRRRCPQDEDVEQEEQQTDGDEEEDEDDD